MSKDIKDPNIAEEQVPEQDELGELLKKIEELQADADSYKDKYIRSVADLENIKKRSFKEKEELRKLLTSGFLENLLPIVDGFNAGLEAATQTPEAQKVTEGFQMVVDQLANFLKRYEVDEINPVNEPFDPNFHECVAQSPSEEIPEGKVLQVIRVGYSLKERLIRPATVVVSSGPVNDKE